MRLLSFLLVACAALVGSVMAAAGDNHAREHQNTPLWINIPVPPSDLDGILKNTGLTADVYSDGNAYIQILTYNLDKLETWLSGKWVDVTITPGWVLKLNILVQGPKGPGYMIHDIDFQLDSFVDWFTGLIRNVGAIFDQKIPSHPCKFVTNNYSPNSTSLSMMMDCNYINFKNNIWNWIVNDGISGSATFTRGAGNGITTDDFVKFTVVRNNKYLKQNDGTIVWADVTKPDVERGLDQWYPLQAAENTWAANILKTRLGLNKNYPICSRGDKNYCFWGSFYGLIDHVNTVIQAKSNSVEVDGITAAPSDMTADPTMISANTANTSSNNMIWLYGILVGAGAAIMGGLAVYAVMTYHARGQQVLKATQHVAAEMA